MKRLSLLRHAKSAWDDPNLEDVDRPLNGRGRKAAPLIGAALHADWGAPDQILCSVAERTRETCSRVCATFKTTPPVKFIDRLYLASPAEIMAEVARTPDDLNHLLVIGHNPGLEMIALELAKQSNEPDATRMRTKFPTAGLAQFEIDAKRWKAADSDNARLHRFTTPADLSDRD
ncbi:MAG: histidine phosphatase family protein [Pseudomonadota bacterium]